MTPISGVPVKSVPWHRLLHHSESHQIGDDKFEAKFNINLWQECAYALIEFFADDDRRAGAIITTSNVLRGPWESA